MHAPIGAKRRKAAFCRPSIVPNPLRQGIEPEHGHIVAKMRDGWPIVNGTFAAAEAPGRRS